jgi:nucleoside-diphosphate-sugar epimerase
MRLLITGVSGFVGRHTALTALHAGHEVIAVGRRPLTEDLKNLGVHEFMWTGWPTKISSGELQDLVTKFGSLDAVIHIAGDPHYGNGEHYHAANVVPTDLLARAVLKVNPDCKFVLASSVGAQDFPRLQSSALHNESTKPAPKSDYGRSKLAAENIVIKSGLSYAIARLGMVIGQGMRADSHVSVLLDKSNSSLIRHSLSLLRGVLPLVHVNDVAAALLLLSEKNSAQGTYLVVTENTSIKNVVNGPRGKRGGSGSMGLGIFAGFLPAKITSVISPVMRFDSAKLKALGWKPNFEIRSSINDVYISQLAETRETHIVTGVASGLGRAFLEELISDSRQIIGIDRDRSAIADLKRRYPSQIFICGDVTDPDLFDQVLEVASENYLRIKSLYLIAGLGQKAQFIDHEFINIRLQFEVNVIARIHLSQRFLQYLRSENSNGRLVVVSSSTALQPLPEFAVYSATNAALLSFGRALIEETSAKLCQVLILVPGGMNTNFQQNAGVRRLEKERLLNPTTVARKIVHSSSKKSKILIIGRNARIAHILSRFLSWKTADAVWCKLTKLTR